MLSNLQGDIHLLLSDQKKPSAKLQFVLGVLFQS